MADGYIQWYDVRKGGYIVQEDGQPTIFVDRRVIENAGFSKMRKGQKVSYKIATDTAGQASVTQILLIKR